MRIWDFWHRVLKCIGLDVSEEHAAAGKLYLVIKMETVLSTETSKET
jgi:hypothetical protein